MSRGKYRVVPRSKLPWVRFQLADPWVDRGVRDEVKVQIYRCERLASDVVRLRAADPESVQLKGMRIKLAWECNLARSMIDQIPPVHHLYKWSKRLDWCEQQGYWVGVASRLRVANRRERNRFVQRMHSYNQKQESSRRREAARARKAREAKRAS